MSLKYDVHQRFFMKHWVRFWTQTRHISGSEVSSIPAPDAFTVWTERHWKSKPESWRFERYCLGALKLCGSLWLRQAHKIHTAVQMSNSLQLHPKQNKTSGFIAPLRLHFLGLCETNECVSCKTEMNNWFGPIHLLDLFLDYFNTNFNIKTVWCSYYFVQHF